MKKLPWANDLIERTVVFFKIENVLFTFSIGFFATGLFKLL